MKRTYRDWKIETRQVRNLDWEWRALAANGKDQLNGNYFYHSEREAIKAARRAIKRTQITKIGEWS